MTCASAQVAGLTPAQLVAWLEGNPAGCVNDIAWTLDANLRGVLSTAHLTAVLNRIAAVGALYQGDDQQHLRSLMLFVHAAYYLKFYNAGDPGLFTLAATSAAAIAAFDAFAASNHVADFNATAASIAYDWVCAVDGAVLGDRYYAQWVAIVQAFNAEPQRRGDYGQGLAVWSVLLAVKRQIDINAAFKAAVNESLIDAAGVLALNDTLPSVNDYLPGNAINRVLRSICNAVPAWKAAAVAALSSARSTWPHLSPPWLWAVEALDNCNGCLDSQGVSICKAAAIADLEAQYLPNTYTFDDGALVVRTPLPLPQVQTLYHAAKIVEAQFNRLTQTITPLPGDPNGTLTMIVFGDCESYRNFAPFMYGIDTNNGGMYLEGRGTFYTYERTNDTYTLEELFRHEYTHYLVGRFIAQGMWNETPIYQNNRLVWFDEGMAEFCTWSTPDTGIKVRRRLVQMVQQDGQNRMTVSQILHATYGNFDFYRYAALLFAYWYKNDLPKLLTLIELVRAGNVANYDAMIAQLSANGALNTAYQQFLDGLVASLDTLDDPSTEMPPLTALDLADAPAVQAQVRTTRIGYLAVCSVAAVDANTRFSARGTLSGQLVGQKNLATAWRAFDADLNEMITALKQSNSNNFIAACGRFGQIRWVDSGGGQTYAMADYFLDGPLMHGVAQLQPLAQQITADVRSTRLGINGTVVLLNATTAEVRVTLTTRLYPDATSADVLLAELVDGKVELQNQLYAIRPPYYRDFTMDWAGAVQAVPYQNQQKYGLRNVIGQVRIG